MPRLILVGLVGLVLGLVFADIDLSLARLPLGGLIQHRSLLTHGLLVPLALFQLVQARPTTLLRPFTIGFSLATATHLAFDLFPWNWRGFARVHVPLVGWLDPTLSILWLLVGVGVSLWIAFVLVRQRREVPSVWGGLALAFALAATREPAFWLPLLVLAASVWLAWTLARGQNRWQ